MRAQDICLIGGGIALLYAGAAAGAFALAENFGITQVIPLFTDTPVREVLGPNIVFAAGSLLAVGALFGTALAFPNRMKWLNDNLQ